MQQVKADAAALRIKDGFGQQMVEIDQVGRSDNETSLFPIVAPNKRRDQEGYEPMPAVV